MKASKSLIIGDLTFNYAYRSPSLLGLIVSRRYGNSVMRNLFKRRCRSLFREHELNNDNDIALVVRPNKQNVSFINMHSAFGKLYDKIGS